VPRRLSIPPAAFPTKSEWYLRKWFHMSRAQLDSMLAAQDGRCWVCRRPFAPSLQPQIDHDQRCCNTKAGHFGKIHPRASEGIGYSCGRCVRCLLCKDCNLGLGRLESVGATSERVARYLSEFVEATSS